MEDKGNLLRLYKDNLSYFTMGIGLQNGTFNHRDLTMWS